jgi:hypothetical protein
MAVKGGETQRCHREAGVLKEAWRKDTADGQERSSFADFRRIETCEVNGDDGVVCYARARGNIQ